MSERRQADETLIVSTTRDWYNAGRGFGLSFRDLSRLTGIPLGTTYRICVALREDGRLTFDDGVARSIRINGRKKK